MDLSVLLQPFHRYIFYTRLTFRVVEFKAGTLEQLSNVSANHIHTGFSGLVPHGSTAYNALALAVQLRSSFLSRRLRNNTSYAQQSCGADVYSSFLPRLLFIFLVYNVLFALRPLTNSCTSIIYPLISHFAFVRLLMLYMATTFHSLHNHMSVYHVEFSLCSYTIVPMYLCLWHSNVPTTCNFFHFVPKS